MSGPLEGPGLHFPEFSLWFVDTHFLLGVSFFNFKFRGIIMMFNGRAGRSCPADRHFKPESGAPT